ncbi:MAG: hypothetical protein KIT84_33025 [Labilithrix sp.]|nr:hypothetical protein [Labilithrix sp.]MCW5815899.1 hypothetical protein [Labilithrix sp.]
MKIALRKISDERHELVIRSDENGREAVLCETRSLLRHDLLHFAVEAEARLEHGFWGHLARGKTLADMNDRSGVAMADAGPELAAIERLVGALDAAAKGHPADEVVAGIRRFHETSGLVAPTWLDVELVRRVQERMRRLLGEWKALPVGGTMHLSWPPPPA